MFIKLLQVTAAYKPAYIYGGPTMSVAKLCEALTDMGPEVNTGVEVLTTTANGPEELPVVPGKQIIVDGVPVTYYQRITKDHTHFSPALLHALWKKIKAHRLRQAQPDKPTHQLVIHIHAWWNLVSVFSCYLAKWYHIPVVLSPRGMLTPYTQSNRNSFFKSTLHFLIGKSLLRYCHIHATSEKEKQDILKFITPQSITVIHNLVNLPVEVQKLNAKHQKQEDQPFKLLFLSRINVVKGIEVLLDALADLPFNYQFTIAGSGEETYIESLKLKAKDLKIENNIDWIGHVHNDKKFELMAKNDLLILTSVSENFANVVVESLSVGTPVLLSDQVGLAAYIKENELGWISSLAAENIQQEIINAYHDESRRKRIRTTGPQIIANDFDQHHVTQQYLHLYQQIIDGKL